MKKVVKKKKSNKVVKDVTITLYPDEVYALEAYAEKHDVSRSLAIQRCVRLCFQLDKGINKGKLK